MPQSPGQPAPVAPQAPVPPGAQPPAQPAALPVAQPPGEVLPLHGQPPAAADAPPAITPEAVAQYQADLTAYYQQQAEAQIAAAKQAATADMQLRVALARAGVHHDGYTDYLAAQYTGLPTESRPAIPAWIEAARAANPAFFAQPAAPATAPTASPQAAPVGWSPAAATPPPAAWPAAPAVPAAPPVAQPPAAPWHPAPVAAPPVQPVAPAAPPVAAQPPAQPAAPPVPPWQRTSPEAGAAPSGPGAVAEPPLTEAYVAHIAQHDLRTYMRRHAEIRKFMSERRRAR